MKKFLFFTIFTSIILTPFIVKAGFGISPPFIENNHLTPGSYFEKTIYLVRSDPSEDMTIEAIIEAPTITSWITIDDEFVLPKGTQQFPLKVGIKVPSDATYGIHLGYIRIRKKPLPGDDQIALGAKIDIKLTVTGEALSDFKIKGVSTPGIEKGNPLTVLIMLENTGNTRTRPSKVHLDIYDVSHTKIMESGDITGIELVEPFETKQIKGEMKVDLEAGEYWADISIYKDEKVTNIFKVHFKVTFPIEEVREEETREIFLIKIIIIILLTLIR